MDENTRTRRSWTDDELREAIGASRSWRGVLRHLGLNPSSSNSKKYAVKAANGLGLSTTHFTGQRTWNDTELRRAAAGCLSWSELIDELGLRVNNPVNRRTVRAHATRLGLPLGHLDVAKVEDHKDEWAVRGDSRYLRRAAPSIALAWFALRGIPCMLPIEPEPYDLIAHLPEGFEKIQVKSTTYRDSADNFQVMISQRRSHGSFKDRSVPYDPGDVDRFFIVDGESNVYLIPLSAIGGKITLSLNAWKSYQKGNVSGLMPPGPATTPGRS